MSKYSTNTLRNTSKGRSIFAQWEAWANTHLSPTVSFHYEPMLKALEPFSDRTAIANIIVDIKKEHRLSSIVLQRIGQVFSDINGSYEVDVVISHYNLMVKLEHELLDKRQQVFRFQVAINILLFVLGIAVTLFAPEYSSIVNTSILFPLVLNAPLYLLSIFYGRYGEGLFSLFQQSFSIKGMVFSSTIWLMWFPYMALIYLIKHFI